MLVPNTRVLIHGDAGDAIGHVLDVHPVDEMPDIIPHPSEEIRDAIKELKEANVDHVALILYDYNSVPVVFSVLEIAGQWYDLRNRKLTFETIGIYRE